MGLTITQDTEIEVDFNEFLEQIDVGSLLDEMLEFNEGELKGDMLLWFKQKSIEFT